MPSRHKLLGAYGCHTEDIPSRLELLEAYGCHTEDINEFNRLSSSMRATVSLRLGDTGMIISIV